MSSGDIVTSQTATTETQSGQIFKGQISADDVAGEKALLAGSYAEAQNIFHTAVNKNSKDLSAICGLGFALALQFKLDSAEQQFNQALKLNPDEAMAHVGLALVKLNRLQSSSMSILNQKDSILTNAEAECTTALNAEPTMAVGYIVLGLVQKQQGKLDAAKDSFTKAITFDPKYSAAFVNRGQIEMQQGDTASAIADLQEAVKLRPSNSSAHYALGKAYTKLGQLDKAYSELNTSLSLKNNSAPAHIAMGDVYRLQGNTVAAIREYQAAIAVKAESEDAYLQLANLYTSRGDLEMAAAQLRSGLALSPDNVDLHRKLADVSLQNGKTDDALKEYTTVLSTNPGDVPAVNGMTRALVLKTEKEAQGAYFLSNNYDSAESYIQKAIALNPDSLELRLADVKLKAMAGQPVDLTLVGNPTNDPERIAYAEAAMAQFKFQAASTAITTVINNCQTADQLFAVGDVALLTRDLDGAQAAYKRASVMSGADVSSRARRGLAAVADARQKAQQALTLGKDLSKRNQLASAIDQYRQAAYLNPRLADAHLGLAEALEKFQKNDSPSLREAALHFKAYLSLQTDLPEKEREKIAKRADKCTEIAYKIDQGHPPSRLDTLLSPVGTLSSKVGSGIKDIF